DGRLLGAVAIADTVRPEGQRAVAALGRLGIRTILLTGDTRPVAEAVARSVGIREVEADLLPEDKLERVKALVAASRTVAMVGDGVNDAPRSWRRAAAAARAPGPAARAGAPTGCCSAKTPRRSSGPLGAPAPADAPSSPPAQAARGKGPGPPSTVHARAGPPSRFTSGIRSEAAT